MKSTILAILFFVVGAASTSILYQNVFDPDRFLANANTLAAESYLSGCLDGRKGQVEGTVAFSYEVRWCKGKAKELYDKLEVLRRDPGHK